MRPMTEDLNERIVSLTTALLERDQRILDLEAELRAKEGYIPPPPSGLPTVVIEGINDMADNIRGKIERTKVLGKRGIQEQRGLRRAIRRRV